MSAAAAVAARDLVSFTQDLTDLPNPRSVKRNCETRVRAVAEKFLTYLEEVLYGVVAVRDLEAPFEATSLNPKMAYTMQIYIDKVIIAAAVALGFKQKAPITERLSFSSSLLLMKNPIRKYFSQVEVLHNFLAKYYLLLIECKTKGESVLPPLSSLPSLPPQAPHPEYLTVSDMELGSECAVFVEQTLASLVFSSSSSSSSSSSKK